MVLPDGNPFDEIEKLKFTSVDEKITMFLMKQIEKCEKDHRVIGWIEFRKYCHEFGMIEPPNILTVPLCVVDRCFYEAKKRMGYIG